MSKQRAVQDEAVTSGRSHRAHVDDHAVFARNVEGLMKPGFVALDAGAGRGERYPYDYAAMGVDVVGVDRDRSVAANPNIQLRVLADLAELPFAAGTFDLVFSKFVFEHLERPRSVLRALRRVMKTGGHLVFHTPNRHHYVAWAASLTPQSFHVWFNGKRGCDRDDLFPTFYRINDRRTIHRIAEESGFRVARLEMIEPSPDYLFFHPAAYRAGELYETIVGNARWLAGLRCVIVGDLVAA